MSLRPGRTFSLLQGGKGGRRERTFPLLQEVKDGRLEIVFLLFFRETMVGGG